MTTVVERSVDIHDTADDVSRVLSHDFADAAARNSLMKQSAPNRDTDPPTRATVGGRVFTGRPSPANQRTTDKLAPRDHGSHVAIQ